METRSVKCSTRGALEVSDERFNVCRVSRGNEVNVILEYGACIKFEMQLRYDVRDSARDGFDLGCVQVNLRV